MIFTTLMLSLLLGTLQVHACTTIQPVFELPLNATNTVYASTITTTSSIDCGGCSLAVSTFGFVLPGPTNPPQTTTVTDSLTTSISFICLPSATTLTSNSTSSPSVPMPTLQSLPPVSSTVQTLINDLFTALLYVELISNGGDSEKLCSIINPPSLNQIPGIEINGSAIQRQVCAAGALNFYSPDLVPPFIVANQRGVSYLATALFAVQVAGNYAGGTNLSTLCAEIQTTYVNDLFGGYLLGVGTAVKDYVCSAASASPSPSSGFTDTTITPSPAFKLS